MSTDNPYNFVPLNPTGKDEKTGVNTYSPEDMIKIYEQQFLIPVPQEKLTEFLPALKRFYDIDDNTLDVSAVIFDAIADATIIYNHKASTGEYQILGGLVVADLVRESAENNTNAAAAYTLDCMRTFFINDVEIPYHFNLFVQGDGYSTLTQRDTVLEKIYWLVNAEFEANLLDDPDHLASLESINEDLARLGITQMDLATVQQLVNYIEDHIIDDDMIDALNALIDDVE